MLPSAFWPVFLAAPLSAQTLQDFNLTDVNVQPKPLDAYVQVESAGFPSDPLYPYFLDPQLGLMHGGRTYFYASTAAHGDELWVTDGTTAGTQMLADINPGPGHSFPRSFVALGDAVYFAASDPANGRELWKTDGTTAGTLRVGDLVAGPLGLLDDTFVESERRPDRTQRIVEYAGTLYFRGKTASHGVELWSSDGTAAGTALFADIWPGPNSSTPAYLTPTSLGLYFSAEDNLAGNEPWVTGGPLASTQRLADLQPGSASSSAHGFVQVGPQVVFRANSPATGTELFRTAGTPATTTLLTDLFPGGSSSNPALIHGAALSGWHYFRATNGTLGEELFRTNGATTQLVADLNPGIASSQVSPLTPAGSRLVFAAKTANGPKLLAVEANNTVTELIDYDGGGLGIGVTDGANAYLFAAPDGGDEVLRTDGTPAGSISLARPTVAFAPDRIAQLPGGGAMVTGESAGFGFELHRVPSAGTALSLFADLDPTIATHGANVRHVQRVGGRTLYFSADDGVSTGLDPFRWDPVGGLVKLADTAHVAGNGTTLGPREFTPVWRNGAGQIYFVVDVDNIQGASELWRSDGTQTGTQRVLAVEQLSGARSFRQLVAFAGRLAFVATSGVTSKAALFVSDGTVAGSIELNTYMLGASTIGFDGPAQLTPFQNGLAFVTSANEVLWTDGTIGGTQRLYAPHDNYTDPQGLFAWRDQLVLFVQGLQAGIPVWEVVTADLNGTTQLQTFAANINGQPVPVAETIGPDLYFAARKGPTNSYWKSDLTAAGTTVIAQNQTPALVSDARRGHRGTQFGIFYQHGPDVLGFFNGSVWTPMPTDATLAETESTLYTSRTVAFAGDGLFRSVSQSITMAEIRYADFAAGEAQVWSADDLQGASWGGNMVRELVLVDGKLVWVTNQPNTFGEELYAADLTGAYVQELNFGSSAFRFEASEPVLGATLRMNGLGIEPGQPSIVFLSGLLLEPSNVGVSPTTPLWLNPLVLQSVTVQLAPNWSYLAAVPAAPALAGHLFGLQAGYVDSATGQIVTSNGLLLHMGL